jgi:hypothetical protein
MALTSCRECRGTVSSEAPTCPHCGVPSPAPKAAEYAPPTAPKRLPQGATSESQGIWWLIGTLVVVVVLAAYFSRSPASPESAAPNSRTALDSKRERDSVAVQALLAGAVEIPVATLFSLEARLHQNGFDFPHDSAHERYTQLALDSVALLVRDGPERSRAARALHRLVVVDSGSAAARRKATLDRRITAHERTMAQREERAAASRRLDARKAYARDLEVRLLDEGMDVRVATRGTDHTTLRMTYVLVNRVWAHQLSKNGEMFARLRQLGFTRLELRDGYNESYSWDLR